MALAQLDAVNKSQETQIQRLEARIRELEPVRKHTFAHFQSTRRVFSRNVANRGFCGRHSNEHVQDFIEGTEPVMFVFLS